MKKGLPLTELAATLERQSAAKVDYVADTRELTFLTARAPERDAARTSELTIPEAGELEVTTAAHRQLGERLGIPARYYDRLRADHPSILDENVNGLFRESPGRRMVRAYDWDASGDGGGRVARAFLSDRYRRLDNDQLAEAILPVLGEIPDVRIESAEITDRRMYIKAVAPRVEGEVKAGDVVQAGVVVSNSEIGEGSLRVQPMVFRLVCLNGMIAADATKRYHVGRAAETDETYAVLRDETLRKDDEAVFAKLADVTRAAVDETRFNAIVASLREKTGGPAMERPIEGVKVLASRFDLGEGEKESVLRHLVEGGDLSAYGVLNAVTRASQDVESYDRATELEEVGGRILAMGDREWGELVAA